MTVFSESEARDCSIPEIEDKGKELICDPFSYPHNQSILFSIPGSFVSFATPEEADLDDEQIRALLFSLRYLPEREQMRNDQTLITLKEKV